MSMKFGYNLLSALQSTALAWKQDWDHKHHTAEAFSQHHGDK
jgi:hypothetical protein